MGKFPEKIGEATREALLDPRFTSRNQLSSGRVFFVLPTSATNYAQFVEDHPDYKSGDGVVTVAAVYNTIDAAVGACTADQGDIIYVMPGHTETVTGASGLDLDVAGIYIIGIGSGSLRPTVNFTTATAADMDVAAANITIRNILFTGGIDALANPIHIAAADCKLIDIETRDVTGQATDFIVTTAAADRLLIDGWVHRGAAAAGADTAISIVGGDGITIRNFNIYGNFAVACIENVTTAATNLVIGGFGTNNFLKTVNAADVVVTLVATATGFVGPNIAAMLKDDAANITEAFVGADMAFIQPIRIVNADGESSIDVNITASTDGA
ncbi:hypothetical protein KAJ89_03305 [Candidatus Parcubacteria bacterium]|nr:hypothetical protein [Candidatus Parcubacteria bacterium]